jgi:hypothetical protein
MDVSSLYKYASLYMPAYSACTSSAAQSSSQDDTGSEDFGTIFGSTLSNSDRDTVQLSSSGMAPPMMDNDTTSSDIKSFLDKVANGTATATDLQNMETELEQATSSTDSSTTASTGSSTTASTSSSTTASSIRSDLKSFLDKVANGTATATDLQSMEAEMEQVQEQAALNSAISAYSNSNADYSWNSTESTTA